MQMANRESWTFLCWQHMGHEQHVLHMSQALQHLVSLQLRRHVRLYVGAIVLTGLVIHVRNITRMWLRGPLLCRCSCGPLLVLLHPSAMMRWLHCASHQVLDSACETLASTQ